VERSLTEIVNNYHKASDLKSLIKAAKSFSNLKNNEPDIPREYTKCNIWVLSNYSTQFIAASLPLALADKNIWANVQEAGYNEWEAVLFNTQHEATSSQTDLILLLLSSFELAFRRGSSPEALAKRIAEPILSGASKCVGRLIVALPEPLPEEHSSSSWAYKWRHNLVDSLKALLAETDVLFVDISPLIRKVGSKKWYAERYYINAKIPFNPNNTHFLVEYLSRFIRSTIAISCKLLITDLDDTLWAGTVGEEGWDNIDLDANGTGLSYLRLQRFLQGLKDSGVLLAIASKNELQNAMEVFQKRSEMILKASDFSALEINWKPKSEGIKNILRQMNLSTSGVVFIDDNPRERFEVKTAFPEIIVPELPAEHSDWIGALIDVGIFEGGISTEEGERRSEFYKEEGARQKGLKSAASLDTYLQNLEMTLFPLPIEKNYERVIELINKTNQFNVATRRHGRSEVAEMLNSGAMGICFKLKDRFGNYGIISVFLAVPCKKNCLRIDTWVMSCRAMGRTVESAILFYVLTKCKEEGVEKLIGEYIPTARNKPISSLYPSFSFKHIREVDNRVFSELDIITGLQTVKNPFVNIIYRAAS